MNPELVQHPEIMFARKWLPERPEEVLKKQAGLELRTLLQRNTIRLASHPAQQRVAALIEPGDINVFIENRKEPNGTFFAEITADISKELYLRNPRTGERQRRIYEKPIEPQDIVCESITQLSDEHRAALAALWSNNFMDFATGPHQLFLDGNMTTGRYRRKTSIDPADFIPSMEAVYALYHRILENKL